MPTIGLVMTTYNEEKVIKRCLESVLPYIDYYSIGVDLKTTDNTKSIIEETLKDKTGVVFDSPWRGFADARNQAFEHFTWDVDWFLIIDADMILHNIDMRFDKNDLDNGESGYLITINQNDTYWNMNWLVSGKYNWVWKGVLHEYIECQDEIKPITICRNDLMTTHQGDGGARPKDSAMFKRDADVFLNEMVKETDPFLIQRYTFYLAQSYRDAGMEKESIIFYRLRARMGGWPEEVYLSYYYAGRQSNDIEDYFHAMDVIPTRSEALADILHKAIEDDNMENINRGLHYYDKVMEDNLSWNTEGLFFVDKITILHDWAAIAMGKVGRIEESKKMMLKLYDEYLHNEDYQNADRLKNNLSLFKEQGF